MSSVHIVPQRIYWAIFGALLVLTVVTVQVSYVDLGPLNSVVALAIAGFKALLVVLYFMHVRYGSRLVGIVIAVAVLWLAVLIVVTLTDYLSRGWLPFPGK